MTKFRRLLTTAAATAALLTAGTAGAAVQAPVQNDVRAAAATGESRFIEPGSTATIISIGILAVFTLVVLLTTDDDNGEGGSRPNSP